jgi:hypothetical protein
MTRQISVLRGGLRRLSVRFVARQIALAILLFLLWALWLNLPDASALEVLASVIVALLILAIAGGGESALILQLCGRKPTPTLLARGALLMVVAAGLWFAWSALITALGANDPQWAAYWNSQLPHQLRYVFTYGHIALWLGWFWNTLAWAGAGVLAIFVVSFTASLRPMRSVTVALRSVSFWLWLLLGTFVASAVTSSLFGWTPGHGLRREMASLGFRLCAAVAVEAFVLCVLLATLAECVRRADDLPAAYSAPAGTPDESQPRTVDNP